MSGRARVSEAGRNIKEAQEENGVEENAKGGTRRVELGKVTRGRNKACKMMQTRRSRNLRYRGEAKGRPKEKRRNERAKER